MHSTQGPDVVALAAFSGWNDAGSASTDALTHLINAFGVDEALPGGERVIDANSYIDFQINRPVLSRTDAGARTIEWPHTRVMPLSMQGERRFISVMGPEPSFNWRGYCEEVLAALRDFGATRLVTLGALLADTPHTRPLPVSVTRFPRSLDFEVGEADGGYEGPIGIPTVLADMAAAQGLPTTSVWVQVPNYVSQNPVPKATLALVRTLSATMDVQLEVDDLSDDAEAWERGMDELTRGEDDISAYVQQLEKIRDESELPEASGEAIASEFEEFLRGRDSRD